MGQFFSKGKNEYLGWIIVGVIVLLLLTTIFIGRFFKGEEKIKLKFKNGQTLSFFVASYNSKKVIRGAFALFFQTKTNRWSIVSLLPKTYLNFGEDGYFTLEESLAKKQSYDDIKNSVANLLGTSIDYYIFMDKEDLIKLVDMIRGVEIFTEAIRFPVYNVNIPQGVVLLDGDKAVEYLSFRNEHEESSEYKQLKRIQNFMRGFMKLKVDYLEQFNKNIVANFLYRTITSNLAMTDFLIIYDEITDRYKNGLKDFSAGMKDTIVYCDTKEVSGYDEIYLPKKSGEWIKSEVSEILQNIQKPVDDKTVGNVVIEVLNGTDIVGLALRANSYLSSYGFDVLNVGNADREDYENTVIIIRRSEQKARKVGELIGCERIIPSDDTENDKIDATLILGRDFDGRMVR
jgi:polyisoprenyl-teichoic acid--peptidoglycan teichoic acid transferase